MFYSVHCYAKCAMGLALMALELFFHWVYSAHPFVPVSGNVEWSLRYLPSIWCLINILGGQTKKQTGPGPVHKESIRTFLVKSIRCVVDRLASAY
jgi:hypothetical protein